jgi:hypothetical protein
MLRTYNNKKGKLLCGSPVPKFYITTCFYNLEYELVRICSSVEEKDKWMQMCAWKISLKTQLRIKWKDKIRIGLVDSTSVVKMEVTLDHMWWQALVLAVLKFHVPTAEI